jgi:hypothetical protein
MRGLVLLAATASLLAAAPALAQTQQQRALGTQSQTGSPPPTDPAAPAAGLGSTATRGDALPPPRSCARPRRATCTRWRRAGSPNSGRRTPR